MRPMGCCLNSTGNHKRNPRSRLTGSNRGVKNWRPKLHQKIETVPAPKHGERIQGTDVVDLDAWDATLGGLENSWDMTGFPKLEGMIQPPLPPNRTMHELHLHNLNEYQKLMTSSPSELSLDIEKKRSLLARKSETALASNVMDTSKADALDCIPDQVVVIQPPAAAKVFLLQPHKQDFHSSP